jgi:FlaA1/EpsC-like NDP-sugar epimerase
MHRENPSGTIRHVAVEDLLGRKPVQLDHAMIRERIRGNVVMVTGAAGSIGSELCRQIALFEPLQLIGFDHAETPLFHLERELHSNFPRLKFHPEVGSIRDAGDVNRAMEHYRPSIVYHAAAYKHVPMMEKQVFAVVENNIFGTWQVAIAAARHDVQDFVLISTDKAVRPSSIMGASKRVAELVIRALQKPTGTRFVAVRFGNVLGSSGSVLPIFQQQIAAGGPLTVTHPEMRRYFMTATEAAQFVLQTFLLGNCGQILVLDMGEPVKIVELANSLIQLSGFQPEREIKIEFTGVRPGEKLFEELNLQAEQLAPTSHPRIRSLISPEQMDEVCMGTFLKELREAVDVREVPRVLELLHKAVPDYRPALPAEDGVLSKQADVENQQCFSGLNGPQVQRERDSMSATTGNAFRAEEPVGSVTGAPH